MGKEYVCVLQFKDLAALKDEDARKAFSARLQQALATLRCAQLQLPPKEGCAVKRQLRVREIYTLDLLEFNFKTGQAILRASCQAGTYMRTLCVHIGLLMGYEAYMLELRRVRSGELTEKTNLVTLHDVLDSFWCWKNLGDESYLRKVVMPLEYLLKSYKRIFVKDSSINALTYGAPLHIQGVLRYDPRISIGDTVVLVSTKGEAVALGTATMGAQDIMGVSRGIVSKVKRVIMDRDLYDRQWGLGPTALLKKQLIKNGQLDKYGGINKDTPKEWVERFHSTEEFLKTAGNTCGNSTEGANTEDAHERQRGLKK
ncbi:Centromere/microtubule binding protein CBF5 [Giardia lamblia P15]|uniref:Centromere/microtubule binding protein CBF5 n=1 Tax=Giardia intestinalis (strain P15) TaxID=658858 RepID=E1F1K9_GIAIA|nr:Centromere/microtubule binding protein CBF5 [Giardia lamblia P15]